MWTEQLTEQGRIEPVHVLIPGPDVDRLGGIAAREAVEHVAQLRQHEIGHVADAAQRAARHVLAVDGDDALADVLGEVADALELVGDPQDADDLPQIDGDRLAARDRLDRPFLDGALHVVDGRVGVDHPPGALAVAGGQRLDRLGDLPFGKPAHLRHGAGEILQIQVEGFRRVFRPSHGVGPIHAARRRAAR